MVGVQNSGPAAMFAVRSRIASMMSSGYSGARGEAGVLEVVDAGREPAADLLGPMRVRDDRQVAPVRLVDDGLHFLHRHLVLVDQLDDVDAGVGELAAPWRARRRRPLTPQRNSSVPGYGSCWMNGPET